MLIPIGTSVQKVRRVPYVTFSLMVINALVCLYTSWMTDVGDARFFQIKQAIVELSAYYPYAQAHGDAAAVIAEAQRQFPDFYRQAAHPDDAALRNLPPVVGLVRDGRISANDAMAQLETKLVEAEQHSFSWNYAFHSYRPTPISLITATFLHSGIFHLLGNMWFLYLTGTILEGSWGSWLFGSVYLLGGIAALGTQAVARPDSFGFVLGASGAVAACMGAFMVRFPLVDVKLRWIFVYWFRFVNFDFSVRSLYLLPAWLVLEILYAVFSPGSVAHWAHVGGFIFGMGAAVLVERTGLENFVNREDERLTWHPDAEILAAVQQMESGKPDEAAAVLQRYLAKNPESIDAYETLLRAVQSLGDRDAEKEILGVLCRLSLDQKSYSEGWKRYEEWLEAGGGPASPGNWMELCRFLERERAYLRAVEECERLSTTYPDAQKSFDALLMAARISLEKLNQPKEAKRLFLAAQKSRNKDLAMEGLIEDGLKRCAQRTAKASAR